MSRMLAIGDIHGCYRALQTLADLVSFTPDDTVVFLGDYVNRGPDTRSVLDWLIDFDQRHKMIPLRGNHDILMVMARHDRESYRKWIACGGKNTLKSYRSRADEDLSFDSIPDEHWRFLESRLTPYFESPNHFFVHANARADLELADQPESVLHWEKLRNPSRHLSGKVMVCGHTVQKTGVPFNNGHAICIDTWACGKGWLTCLDVDRQSMWQANELGETRMFSMRELESPPNAG